MTSSFTVSRDRDAWAAIRGFVYQVDVTLVRWLSLADNELLELERGEDIDRITCAASEQRLVEQVKAVAQPISLRNERALEALANAVDHVTSNSHAQLTFRFTTTARFTREQEHPDTDGLPGIGLWEKLRRGLAGDAAAEALRTIQTLLVRAQRPHKIPEEIWERAQQTFSDAASLRALVARFEWATAATPAEDLAHKILGELQQSGRAPSRDRAQRLYEQLFVRVFRLLARSGLKQLSRADLEEEIARHAIPEADRALAQTLRLAFERLDERVAEVEKNIKVLSEQSRFVVGRGLPDPINSAGLSLEQLAHLVESVTGGRVEILAQHGDRLFLWLKRGRLDHKDVKFVILAAACLLSGVIGALVLEMGFSDTAVLHGSLGDKRMGDWRVRVNLAEAREIALSKSVPDGLWKRTEVLLTAGDNLRVGENVMSVDDWEVSV